MAKPAQSKVGAERARLFKQTVFNPIKGLTPAKLATALDAWDRGYIRDAALIWQKIMERDDQVKTCHPKRTRNVTGLDWDILTVDDSPAAAEHQAALKHFYNNLSAVNALEMNERGGLRLLLKHMMTAVGMRYACHEIVWNPGAPGGLTAEFRFLPLHFFENTTGSLRFLKSDFELTGVELDEFFGPGSWMVTTGEGLMQASSVAYMFKSMPLKAWVTYCEKFGIPGLHAKTSASQDSAEWTALVDAVQAFGEDLAIVTNEGASIETLELKSSGNQPHPALVERMDRALSRLWMGGDLATMSATGPSGTGSNAQTDDLEQLKADDAAMVTDTFQHYVDRQVIAQRYGPEVPPLAYFKLKLPARVDLTRELSIDDKLIAWGVPVGQADLRERYGRSEPAANDDLAKAPSVAAPAPFGQFRTVNERRRAINVASPFDTAALKELSQAQAATLRPLVARIEAILALPDDKIDGAIEALQRDLPRINREVLKDAQVQLAFEKILSAAFVSGATEAAQSQQSKP